MFPFICKSLATLLLGVIHPNEILIENVQQLTFSEMGFTQAGEAYFSPGGDKIIFQAIPKGENGYQIYTLDLDTHEVLQVSQNAQTCTCAYFHPGGDKIIYSASPIQKDLHKKEHYTWDLTPYMNIYEANIDGSNAVALTKGSAYHAECAYSPDGSQIVYASNEEGSMNIYVMQSDGSAARRLTHTTHCYNGGPFFSPDGTKIIFRADRDIPHLLQVYMMDNDGSNLMQITHNDAVNWAPFWHPSQTMIAYTTSIHGHHNHEIYLFSLLTGNHYRVTYYPGFNGLPSFNYDGTKILWTSKRGPGNACQIFMADFKLPEE